MIVFQTVKNKVKRNKGSRCLKFWTQWLDGRRVCSVQVSMDDGRLSLCHCDSPPPDPLSPPSPSVILHFSLSFVLASLFLSLPLSPHVHSLLKRPDPTGVFPSFLQPSRQSLSSQSFDSFFNSFPVGRTAISPFTAVQNFSPSVQHLDLESLGSIRSHSLSSLRIALFCSV